MPWGRMDDKFHRNRKVRELRRIKGGREALGTWVYWWSWCLDEPDLVGFVPADELPPADAKAAPLLVEVGLWDEVDGGYQFHDFAEYNPTRQQVEAKKKADRERVAAKREETREIVACDIAGDTEPDTPTTNTRVASTRRAPASQPIPIPNPEEEEKSVSSSRLSLARDREAEPPRAGFARVFEIWNKHVHGGKPVGAAHVHKKDLEIVLKDARLLRPEDPWSLIDSVAESYAKSKLEKGFAPELRYFAADFPSRAAALKTGNGHPKTPSPEVLEYRRLNAERRVAEKARDAAKVADCDAKLIEIQARWDNAGRL